MQAIFSIIIPVFDPFDRSVALGALQRALSGALGLVGRREVVIVNNSPALSCPNLSHYLRTVCESAPADVKLVEATKNLGTARGFNLGLREIRPDSTFVVFMSQDCDIVEEETLQKVELALSEYPEIGIAHPYSVYEDSRAFNVSRKYSTSAFLRLVRGNASPTVGDIGDAELKRICERVGRRAGVTLTANFPLTFAVLRRELLQAVGTFDDGIELGCHETDDLAYRARLGRFEVARLNGVFVNHRRFLFRHICVGGTPLAAALPHQDALKQSGEWWRRKWGRPYTELYARLRLGPTFFWALAPYFVARRFAGRVRRAFFWKRWAA
ncbi:MAG: glycosyltransferase [Acidobacteria bacterium]|nr:MAG: glycosyltransferase [Acidobacteriota bacterium]